MFDRLNKLEKVLVFDKRLWYHESVYLYFIVKMDSETY